MFVRRGQTPASANIRTCPEISHHASTRSGKCPTQSRYRPQRRHPARVRHCRRRFRRSGPGSSPSASARDRRRRSACCKRAGISPRQACRTPDIAPAGARRAMPALVGRSVSSPIENVEPAFRRQAGRPACRRLCPPGLRALAARMFTHFRAPRAPRAARRALRPAGHGSARGGPAG